MKWTAEDIAEFWAYQEARFVAAVEAFDLYHKAVRIAFALVPEAILSRLFK